MSDAKQGWLIGAGVCVFMLVVGGLISSPRHPPSGWMICALLAGFVICLFKALSKEW